MADTQCDNFCPINHKVVSNVCTACESGATRAAGDDAAGNDTFCAATACATDEKVVNHVCTACESGLTNVAGDLATGPDTIPFFKLD